MYFESCYVKIEADHSRRKGKKRGKYKQDIKLRNRKREEEFKPGEKGKGGRKAGENVVRKEGTRRDTKRKREQSMLKPRVTSGNHKSSSELPETGRIRG